MIDDAPTRSRVHRWRAAPTAAVGALVLAIVAAASMALARPPVPTLVHPPAVSVGAPPGTQRDPSRRAIEASLAVQAAALQTGDEALWLSIVDSTAKPLAREYRTRFRVLRAMLVADWSPHLSGQLRPTGPGRWRVDVVATFCLGGARCPAYRADDAGPNEAFAAVTSWHVVAGSALLTAEESTSDAATGANAAAPWIDDDLAVAVGDRVVVAAPADLRGWLDAAVAAGDRAAANADLFALEPRHGRHLVYLAGTRQWRAWFGGGLPEWATAYAPPTGPSTRVVVLNMARISSGGLESSLRHELGHVVTVGDASSASIPFWLAEGVAEWIDAWDRPALSHRFVGPARRYLRELGMPDLERLSPAADDPQWRVSASYGLAYLAVRRLDERYGRAAVLSFFRARRDGAEPDRAARLALGEPWAAIEGDLATYLRGLVE